MISTETDFETQVSLETEAIPIPEDLPFHILFLGDYSGRGNLLSFSEAALPKASVMEIDRDNFEDVLKMLNVSLRLDFQVNQKDFLQLNFQELDDFHPDRIFQQVSLFSDLRDLRERLLSSNTFENAAREVRVWLDDSNSEALSTTVDEPTSEENKESTGNLLDDILTSKVADSDSYKSQTTESPELSSFIKDIVRPHLIQTDEDEQAYLISIVDDSISELMRKILHHPHFKALESAWLGLYFTVRRTETNKDLKLFLFDISKEEVSNNLKSDDDLSDTEFYRDVVINTIPSTNSEPWALICGNYTFELNVDDVATLIRLAKIGQVINAPFISHINPQMLGIESLANSPSSSDWNINENSNEAKLWTMLRTIPEAQNLGFVIPRFLARLPYGEQTEPTEVFGFEEFTDEFHHEHYLWTNPSFAFALLMAQSFSSFAWEMRNHFFEELDGLPTHLYEDNGETKTKSCAEFTMTHQSCDLLVEQGLMPLISFRGTDRIKFGIFQSISFNSKNLQSRWS